MSLNELEKAALEAEYAAERAAYLADDLAVVIGSMVLPRFGRYTVRQALGALSCTMIANAARDHLHLVPDVGIEPTT